VNFIKKNWILIAILLVGAFLRLYKIDSYMTFLGDEGRDVIIVRNLLVNVDPILIGPGTSVGGMYLGPLYYYFMAPFLLLANFSPVGPAIGVALLGVATIYLVYKAGRDWFSEKTGLFTAILYAISPTVITFSHSSWNPNIMPFFALLSVYSIWKVWKLKQFKWLLICSVSYAFVLQSHYLGLLLGPILLIYWFLAKVPLKYNLIPLFVFLFLMSPLVIFDFRHDFMNSKALYKFITVREETVSIKPWTVIPRLFPIFEQINESLLIAKNIIFGKIITLLLSSFLIFSFFKNKKLFTNQYSLITLWLLVGLVGFGIYKQPVYDHYFGFLFPVPFLFTGAFLSKIYESKYKIFSVLMLGYLVSINLINSPIRNYPNNQMQRAKNVSTKVLEIAQGNPFNLAVLAERNYEDGYRYFMELSGAQVMHADRWDQKTIVDNLIVICEMPQEKCDPTHSPKAEVANFGWSKIENQWTVDGVIIYKLIHTQ